MAAVDEDQTLLKIERLFIHVDTRQPHVYTCLNLYNKAPFMQTATTAEQTIQEWGNGLGVRITAPIAKAARFARGLPVRVEVVEGGVFIRTAGKPKLTLAQKLKAYDPAIHGGEVMVTGRIGAEVF